MNNLGEWVGYRGYCDLSDNFAIRWSPQAGITALPLPPGVFSSRAVDINDSGTVVGNCDSRGYIWTGNQVIELPPVAPGQSTGTSAVNNSNVVAGWRNASDGSSSPFLRYVCVWQDGQITDIDPSPYGFSGAEPTDISDSGYVVGIASGLNFLGFRWRAGKFEVLPPLPGADFARAWSVNDAGLAVGESHYAAQPGIPQHYMPTCWGVGGPVQLPLLQGYATGTCQHVNGAGVILGSVATPTQLGLPPFQYVVWIGGIPYAIKPLIDLDNPNSFGTPRAINEAGQILGNGTVSPPGGAGVWILTPALHAADLNGDCAVDGADLSLMLGAWGASGGVPAADLNGDGAVDGADLGALLGAWTAAR